MKATRIWVCKYYNSGPSQEFLAEQLTLSQPGGADYAHHNTTSPPGFSDLATALHTINNFKASHKTLLQTISYIIHLEEKVNRSEKMSSLAVVTSFQGFHLIF